MAKYVTLKAELLTSQRLFQDADFPPNDISLYGDYQKPRKSTFQWKRATDIAGSNAQFIVDGATRCDLDQGKLGNCWFIAAAAALASCPPAQFQRVVPTTQHFHSDYAGIFYFNFWWYGRWKEVVVDDYLPCNKDGLVYCQNREQPNEFWVALLEKAYAKLNGSYEALNGGKLQDALIDFTGGIAEVISLKDKTAIPGNIHETLVAAHRLGSLVGASIHKPPTVKSREEILKPNGLFMGHAYSVTGFISVQYEGHGHKLIRIRNPWGLGEWNGQWSDKSVEMSNVDSAEKKRMDFTKKEDGEFWMPFGEFLSNFDELQMCHLQPDGLTGETASSNGGDEGETWKVSMFNDAWVRGLTAGGCGNPPDQTLYWSNPQYHVVMDQPEESDGKCTLVVSLMQKYWSAKHHVNIGFDIFKMKGDEKVPLDGEKVTQEALTLWKRPDQYQAYRDMCERFRVTPGVYTIIVSTFRPNAEAEYLLRVYTERPANVGLSGDKTGPVGTYEITMPSATDLVTTVFNENCGVDKQVNSHELHTILQQLFSRGLKQECGLNLEMCRSLHVMMDTDRSGYLGLDEVRNMWTNIKLFCEMFDRFDKDKSGRVDTFELGKMFRSLGFPINVAVLKTMVRRYGDRDNAITLTDFIMVVCKTTSLYFMYSNIQATQANPSAPVQMSLNQWLENALFC